MFYCDDCAKEKGWPEDTLCKSVGPCELCGNHTVCNDVPSRSLRNKSVEQKWIEDVWPSYHDSAHDKDLISYFNNQYELNRLNAHRGESTSMYLFNRMLIKALHERNKHLYL